MESFEALDRKWAIQGFWQPSRGELQEIFDEDSSDGIKAIQKKYLEAKGVTRESLVLASLLNNEFRAAIEQLILFEPFGLEEDLEDLKSKFNHVKFVSRGDWYIANSCIVNFIGIPAELTCEEGGSEVQRKEDYKKYLECEIQQGNISPSLFHYSHISDEVVQLVLGLGQCYKYLNDPVFERQYEMGVPMTKNEYESGRKKKYFGLLLMAAGIYSATESAMSWSGNSNETVSNGLLDELKYLNKMVQGFADECGRKALDEIKSNSTGSQQVLHVSTDSLAMRNLDDETIRKMKNLSGSRMIGGHGFISDC